MSHTRRRAGFAAMWVLLVIALSAERTPAQTNAKPAESLPNPYRVVENYFKLPDGRTFGSTPAIDIDRDGRSIWVFERCGRAGGGTPCADSPVAPFWPDLRCAVKSQRRDVRQPAWIHVDGKETSG